MAHSDVARAVEGARPRSSARRVLFGFVTLLAFIGLVLLGNWQVARRAWKLDLITRVESRVNGLPVAAPGPSAWPGVTAANDEYRRVRVAGTFLNDKETLVQAVTILGGGFWVMTPMRSDDGFLVLVNRGFVPGEHHDRASRAAGERAGHTTLVGLMRMTEPKGGFLRANDPAAGRWYSRDVAAIARAQRLGEVAPYFVDADAASGPPGGPIGGLTVIAFPNNHLIYALTWYALAMMVAGAFVIFVRAQPRGAVR